MYVVIYGKVLFVNAENPNVTTYLFGIDIDFTAIDFQPNKLRTAASE